MAGALSLNGVDQTGSLPSESGSTSNAGTSAYAWWIKGTLRTAPDGICGILGTSAAAQSNGFVMNATLQLRVYTAGSNRYGTGNNFFEVGVYHHYRLEHDASVAGGQWRAYRDDMTTPVATGTFTTSTNFVRLNQIGRSSNSSSMFAAFDIEEIGIESGTFSETYIAELSGGSGNILPSVSGNNLCTVLPEGTAVWVGFAGESYDGGAAVTFDVEMSGGGSVIRHGGALSSFNPVMSGGGAANRIGGGQMTLNTVLSGGSSVTRNAGGVFEFSVDVQGGGNALRIGGSAIEFDIAMSGGGEVIPATDEITGGAAVTFDVGMSGGGVVVRIGGAAITFDVDSDGDGSVTRNAGGTAEFDVLMTGHGSVVVSGGADIEFTVNMTGGGNVQAPGYKPVFRAPTITVVKEYRAPYNLVVKKTFRGETCRL